MERGPQRTVVMIAADGPPVRKLRHGVPQYRHRLRTLVDEIAHQNHVRKVVQFIIVVIVVYFIIVVNTRFMNLACSYVYLQYISLVFDVNWYVLLDFRIYIYIYIYIYLSIIRVLVVN